jgi:hypothetical protein
MIGGDTPRQCQRALAGRDASRVRNRVAALQPDERRRQVGRAVSPDGDAGDDASGAGPSTERGGHVGRRLAEKKDMDRTVQQVAVFGESKSRFEQARRARRLHGRSKDCEKVPTKTCEEGAQFTFFGSDQADRFVTTSNCLSRWPINWSASFDRQS